LFFRRHSVQPETFYDAYLKPAWLRFLNADEIARELEIDDVPSEKLVSRFPRTMTNLEAAIRQLPYVLIFDNDDLQTPCGEFHSRTPSMGRETHAPNGWKA